MQCSKCGFVMTALDTECLRCQRQGTQGAAPAVLPIVAAEKECPRCGKAADASAAACDKCGYEYQAEGGSRAERYQARLAQESLAAPPLPPAGLRRSLPPAAAWGIIAACLLVVLGAGWAMFGSTSDDSRAESVMEQPVYIAHRKQPPVGLQSVTYTVTGTAAQALITDKTANAKPVPVDLPWTSTVKAKPGSRLSLSAAPVGPGTVTASLKVNGLLRKQSSTPDSAGQTTVEDKL